MRHLRRSRRLGVKKPHREAMLRNMTKGLIEHGRIKTTVARAKSLRPFVEKLVTRLKDPTVHNIRIVNRDMSDRNAVLALLKIVPTFKDRPGGYLRIMKLAKHRVGDAADMALIEWVEESLVNAYQEAPAPKKAKKATAKKVTSKKAKAADTEEKTEKKTAKKAKAKE